ncbi:hypothetical protein RUM44_001011 [Polyplax serrata]|uniref:Uncharacterized protein n=1 Tax=Polyplax serrata TaxID=468196 RepID=A0ABR1B9M5_POLSC
MKKLKDEKNYKWMSTLGDFEKVRERHETGKQRNEDETRDEGDESEENERAQKDILSEVVQEEALRPAHITPGSVTAEELPNAGPPAKTTLSDDLPLNHLTLMTPRRKTPIHWKQRKSFVFVKK